jgi:dihydrofolate synthase / folylpolyglutamate synthase
MRFGLDRMRRMMTVLGSPERRFETIHVLGTNGKTSTTRMLAAILERHGLRTAAYTSPHLVHYRERVEVREQPISGDQFAAAVTRASWAAERVNRTLGEGDHVTQFELLTAAALWHMSESDVQVAAIEAGLGGRYDATSVIDARVMALTNVALEHTRWLGPTIADIAEEKLAALSVGATLVLPHEPAAAALEVARRVAAERGARVVRCAGDPRLAGLRASGPFQRRNFALARAAAEAHLQSAGIALSDDAVRAAAASVEVPGRLQVLRRAPLTVLDGAHNPAAAAALVEALPGVVGGRPLALVLGVLEDKDAASMLAALLPLCARAFFTAPPGRRALPPAALASLARQLGRPASVCEPDPHRALAQARRWAHENGGAVLATGSVYLIGELLRDARAHERAPGSRARAGAGGGAGGRFA